ncbi:hypothetical protein BDR03DRAFT_20865 [Suillus americanus]|nr:hypothetical protein BDR03DRAFT_20865 [Suillus americanus]
MLGRLLPCRMHFVWTSRIETAFLADSTQITKLSSTWYSSTNDLCSCALVPSHYCFFKTVLDRLLTGVRYALCASSRRVSLTRRPYK